MLTELALVSVLYVNLLDERQFPKLRKKHQYDRIKKHEQTRHVHAEIPLSHDTEKLKWPGCILCTFPGRSSGWASKSDGVLAYDHGL